MVTAGYTYLEQEEKPPFDKGKLLIAKFRLKLKKVGKTTRPFKYDLNQISYDYTVEVTNRLKVLDLIGRVPEEVWMQFHEPLSSSLGTLSIRFRPLNLFLTSTV